MILAEFNTHRTFSRNTSSSRAIPSRKQRQRVLDDPFVPVYIGANQRGIQAGEELAGRREAVVGIWKLARLPQALAAFALEHLGVHKQIANRLVEPWMWTQQTASATDVEDFFWLRDYHMAEPHFVELAGQMHAQLIEASRVFDRLGTNDLRPSDGFKNLQVIFPGDWHLSLIQPEDRAGRTIEELKMISAARCARVSYFLPENGQRSDIARDLELFHRLAGSNPKHLSPLEHPAMAMGISAYVGNFKGYLPVQQGDLGRG